MQHILYIPGLGSENSLNGQKRLMMFWPRANTQIHIFDPTWNTNETSDDKYNRLQDFAQNLPINKGDSLKLVGVSAGGSLAVKYAYDNLDISKIFLLSTKIRGSKGIGPKFQKRASALLQSVRDSESLLANDPSLIAGKTICLRPIFDDVVPIKDMLFGGAKRIRIPLVGHTVGIIVGLLVYMPVLLKK